MRKIRPAPTGTDPNMTPMLDIVFIMLIFFIVTATFVKEAGIMPHVPAGPTTPTDTNNPVIGFQVDANNRVFHDGRMIDLWSVEGLVKKMATENPEAPVVIASHRNAHTRMMVRLYDEAISAGMARNKIAVLIRDE